MCTISISSVQGATEPTAASLLVILRQELNAVQMLVTMPSLRDFQHLLASMIQVQLKWQSEMVSSMESIGINVRLSDASMTRKEIMTAHLLWNSVNIEWWQWQRWWWHQQWQQWWCSLIFAILIICTSPLQHDMRINADVYFYFHQCIMFMPIDSEYRLQRSGKGGVVTGANVFASPCE